MSNQTLTAKELTDLTVGLNRLARNLWWTWNQDAQEIFQELSPRGWQNLYHNGVAILHEVSDYELRVRLQDHSFAQRVRQVLAEFRRLSAGQEHLGPATCRRAPAEPGRLFQRRIRLSRNAADRRRRPGNPRRRPRQIRQRPGHRLSSASAFFTAKAISSSRSTHDNWQVEYYTLLNPRNLPVEPVLDAEGEPLVGMVEIGMIEVFFQAWRVNVGRVVVYLLDTNRPENEQRFRDLTLRVYGGDSTTRIMQEILLGVGGVRLMRALGIQPSVFHMNEGHAAFLTLELIREKLAEGKPFPRPLPPRANNASSPRTRPLKRATTGFSRDLMQFAMVKLHAQLKIPFDELMGLGASIPRTTPNCSA